MKNAELREFKDLLLGERFSEQDTPDEWMIKVGPHEIVPVKSAVSFSRVRPVWVKRGQAHEFLTEIKTMLSETANALNSAVSMLEKIAGKGEKESVLIQKKAEVENETKKTV